MKRVFQGIFAFFVLFLLLVLLPIPAPKREAKLGFTFSLTAAEYLGLPPEVVLEQALNDFKPQFVRIPVYWHLVEPEQGLYDWQAYDRQLQLLEKHGAKAILAIGYKLPRWPECHIPAWMPHSAEADTEPMLSYLQAAVEHFQSSAVVAAWQVENEALFPFGECPAWAGSQDLLSEELLLVRSLDNTRPIITTDSGELSLWWQTAALPIDSLGISVYRAVYSFDKIVHWPVNPYYYRLRSLLVRPFVRGFMVSELQLEPWGSRPVNELPPAEIQASFDSDEMQERFDFASRLGADTILAWGVEWWYYMKQSGQAEYWEAAKKAFEQ